MNWKILLSLCVSYFVYLVIGAAVFSAIERPPEIEQCGKVQEAVSALQAGIRDESRNVTMADLGNITEILQAASSYGIEVDRDFNVTCTINWDFQSAFFFSGTVVTTIGYGHISPNTHLGRSICILYAIIGIPLFALMFSGLGDKIAGLVKKLEARIGIRAKRAWVQRSILIFIVLTSFLVLCLLVPSAIFMAVEEWTYHDSFYYSFITITTIGFGDFVVGINPDISYVPVYRIMVYFWILFGMAFMATVISLITDFWKKTGGNVRRVGKIRREDEVDGGEVAENQEKNGATEINHQQAEHHGPTNEDDDKRYEPMGPGKSTDTSSTESLEQRPFNPHYENTQTAESADNRTYVEQVESS